MSQPPTYWQSRYENTPPSHVVLWVGRRRVLVRVVLAAWGIAVIVLLVVAIQHQRSVFVASGQVFVWLSQALLWGYAFPSQSDEWTRRQAALVHRADE
jgi:hypothetical protein